LLEEAERPFTLHLRRVLPVAEEWLLEDPAGRHRCDQRGDPGIVQRVWWDWQQEISVACAEGERGAGDDVVPQEDVEEPPMAGEAAFAPSERWYDGVPEPVGEGVAA